MSAHFFIVKHRYCDIPALSYGCIYGKWTKVRSRHNVIQGLNPFRTIINIIYLMYKQQLISNRKG